VRFLRKEDGEPNMRKSKREISDTIQIAAVLEGCDTIRVGVADGGEVYIVPVSFGYAVSEGKISVFFHGALEGRKYDLLKKRPRVCVEADRCFGFMENGHGGLTCDYESVIGWGYADLLGGDEAKKGIRLLLEHCGFPDYRCSPDVTAMTAVFRVELDTVTGKRRNLRTEKQISSPAGASDLTQRR
jgi:hypothetical protein